MQIYTRDSLNAIFIQPLATCSGKCKGCYVKEYGKKNGITSANVIPDWMYPLLRKISRNQGIKLNQITISLNDPGMRNGVLYGFSEQLNLLQELPNREHKLSGPSRDWPEIHVCLSVNAFRIAESRGINISNTLAKVADVVNVSIDENKNGGNTHFVLPVRETCSFHLNCNLLFTPRFKIHFQDELINELFDLFDSIYLMAYKPIHGEEYSLGHIESIRNVIEFYNNLPVEKKKKVNIDRCVEVCAKNQYKCSAGINMLTVWPDGGITGCPYSSKPLLRMNTIGNPEETADGTIATMRDMRQVANLNEFNKCKMRNLWPKIKK